MICRDPEEAPVVADLEEARAAAAEAALAVVDTAAALAGRVSMAAGALARAFTEAADALED